MIVLIGLGPGPLQGISVKASEALCKAAERQREGTGALYLRTASHPCTETLSQKGLPYHAFDAYQHGLPADTDTAVVQQLLNEADAHSADYLIAYAVPGSPIIDDSSARMLIELAQQSGHALQIAASTSFAEAALSALQLVLPDGYDVRSASSLHLHDAVDRSGQPATHRPDTSRPLLLLQACSAEIVSHAKQALLRFYPPYWKAAMVPAAETEGSKICWAELQQLEALHPAPFSILYVPALPAELRPRTFEALTGIMARLRAPDGCPWDREQTHQTLRKYLLEETAETLDALDMEDMASLCEELGDYTLQAVFHAQLAAEKDVFNIDDVLTGIVNKLIRRHPHVFGDTNAPDSQTVLKNWERIKKEEKGPLSSLPSALDGVPASLSALMRAQEISKRAVKTGFDWPDMNAVLEKLEEELQELLSELNAAQPDAVRIEAELGDVFFTLVQVARHARLDAEQALRMMLVRFTRRFHAMEAFAAKQNTTLNACTPQQMDELWNRAKKSCN